MDNGDVLTMMARPFCEARCRFEFRAAYNLPYGTSRFVRHDPFLSALTFRPRRFLQTALFEMTWYTCRFILLALKPGTGAPDAAKLAKIPEKTAAAHIARGPDKRHKAHSAHRTCRLWLNKSCMQTGLKRPPRLHWSVMAVLRDQRDTESGVISAAHIKNDWSIPYCLYITELLIN